MDRLCLTVQQQWFAKRRTDTEHDTGQDVLVAREQEQRRVLGVFDVAFFQIDAGRLEPAQSIISRPQREP